MSKHAFTVIVAVIIGLSLLMYLFMYQVRSDQVAVVLTFGKASETQPPPGLHPRWPWPIQQINKFDNRLRVYEGRHEETLTRDRLNIITSFCAGWRIEEPLKFNKNFGRAPNPTDAAWEVIVGHVRDSVSAILGQHDLHDLVAVRGEDLKYESIEEEMRKKASEDTLRIYGVEVELLKIKRIEFPQSVTKSVYMRMNSERQKEAEKIRKDGQWQASNIKTKADSKEKQILTEAQAVAEKLMGEGEAEAAKSYGAFADNPELHRFLIEIETLKKVTNENTTLIMDTTVPPFTKLVDEPRKTD